MEHQHISAESMDVIGRPSASEDSALPPCDVCIDGVRVQLASAVSIADSMQARSVWLHGKFLQVLRSDLVQNWLSPPVLASVLALIIALTPCRAWLVDVEQEDEAAFGFLYKALKVLGSGAVPSQLLVLGANLGNGPSFKGATLRLHVVVALTKMLLMPAVVVSIMYCLAQATVISGGHAEALLLMMVVSSTPSANNLIIMLEVAGKDTTTMSTTIFIQYLLAPGLLTLSLTVFPMLLQTRCFGN